MMSYNDIVVEISCSLYMHSTYDISGIQHYFALRLSRATTTPSWISFLVFRSSHALTFCSNKVRILCGTARPSTFVHSKLFGHKIAGTMTINRTDHHFVLHDKSLEWRWVSSKKENLWTSSPSWYATWCVNFHVLTSNTTGATGASPTHQKLGTTKSMDGCPLGPKHETRYKQANVTAGNSCLVVGFAGHVICRHHKVCLYSWKCAKFAAGHVLLNSLEEVFGVELSPLDIHLRFQRFKSSLHFTKCPKKFQSGTWLVTIIPPQRHLVESWCSRMQRHRNLAKHVIWFTYHIENRCSQQTNHLTTRMGL